MAKFQVITISQEIIKPSSPTPAHLKSFKLSALDQLVPTDYSPVWFFYPNDHKDNNPLSLKMATLKDALSKTLTRFYPLAGRIIDSTYVDCNDQGAIFMQAKVLGGYNDMLGFLDESRNSKFELLDNLLPCQISHTCSVEEAAQIIIKANVFPCGGIAIGVCAMYTLLDATALGTFIKTWADIARSAGQDDQYHHRDYAYSSVMAAASSLFPPNESLKTLHLADLMSLPRSAEEKEHDIIKNFVFDANAIASLQSKAMSKNVPNPSRVEAICGLLWKCLARITTTTTGLSGRPSLFINYVNLRRRLDPPILQEHSLGNFYWVAIAQDNNNDEEKDIAYYADLLRKSFKEIDSNYVKNLQGEQGFKQIRKFNEEAREWYSKSRLVIEVSSNARVGCYDVDFGWGEPIWVATAPAENNEILLIPTKSRGGVEAFVMLDEPRMTYLQHDPDIQAYTTTTTTSSITCNL